jgi:hypothetical protein
MDAPNKIKIMTTAYQIFSPSSSSILCSFTNIFLFCSEPTNKKRVCRECNSNMHNNVLSFRGCVVSNRETENFRKFSCQRIFSGIFSRMFSPKIILENVTSLDTMSTGSCISNVQPRSYVLI